MRDIGGVGPRARARLPPHRGAQQAQADHRGDHDLHVSRWSGYSSSFEFSHRNRPNSMPLLPQDGLRLRTTCRCRTQVRVGGIVAATAILALGVGYGLVAATGSRARPLVRRAHAHPVLMVTLVVVSAVAVMVVVARACRATSGELLRLREPAAAPCSHPRRGVWPLPGRTGQARPRERDADRTVAWPLRNLRGRAAGGRGPRPPRQSRVPDVRPLVRASPPVTSVRTRVGAF